MGRGTWLAGSWRSSSRGRHRNPPQSCGRTWSAPLGAESHPSCEPTRVGDGSLEWARVHSVSRGGDPDESLRGFEARALMNFGLWRICWRLLGRAPFAPHPDAAPARVQSRACARMQCEVVPNEVPKSAKGGPKVDQTRSRRPQEARKK